MKKVVLFKVNAVTPRLSDEEVDPLEAEDNRGGSHDKSSEGWLPWDYDDLIDIRRIIEERMVIKQRIVIEAFLVGQNNNEIGRAHV